MSDFIASDGIRVRVGEVGNILATDVATGREHTVVGAAYAPAMREFFQHERDVELGRWRWLLHPDFVVYPTTVAQGRMVRILNEREPRICEMTRGGAGHEADQGSGYGQAALAYFDAHPEPKPWHDARFGEVWALTDEAGVTMPATFQAPGVWTSHGSMSSRVRDGMNITAARRIWPEAD